MKIEQYDFYYRKCREHIPDISEAEKLYSSIMDILRENPDWIDTKTFSELVSIVDGLKNNYVFGYAKIKDGFQGNTKKIACHYIHGIVRVYPVGSRSYITLAENTPNDLDTLKKIIETKTACIS